MEATLLWAGMAVGGIVLVPMAIDFFKRNLPILFGLVMALLMMYLMAPYSPALRSFWAPYSAAPDDVVRTVKEFQPMKSL